MKRLFPVCFQYCEEERGLPVRKITVETLSPNLIEGYLNWLCEKQKNSASTRNQRLSAIKAFLSLPVEKIHAIFTPAKESSKFPQKSVQRQSYSTFHMRKSRKC
ncbi:MAG: site-specific integrase [Acutalibacteraceae bacterium]